MLYWYQHDVIIKQCVEKERAKYNIKNYLAGSEQEVCTVIIEMIIHWHTVHLSFQRELSYLAVLWHCAS